MEVTKETVALLTKHGHDLSSYKPKVLRAMQFAAEAHRNQKRNYSLEPYIHHPMRVCEIITEHGHTDQNMQCAAILHDTIEDTSVTEADIIEHFGKDVARLVVQLTEISKPTDGNRAVRKYLDRQFLSGACDEAKTIKLADLIHICDHAPVFAKVYMCEVSLLLEVLVKTEVIDGAVVGVPCPLHGILENIVSDYMQEHFPDWSPLYSEVK